jgi:hypothetical protein
MLSIRIGAHCSGAPGTERILQRGRRLRKRGPMRLVLERQRLGGAGELLCGAFLAYQQRPAWGWFLGLAIGGEFAALLLVLELRGYH